MIRGAAALHDAPDGPRTAAPRAWLSFAVIDAEIVLKLAKRAGGLTMVAQRGAARRDGFLEHRLDRLDQRLRALVGPA
jgi:hypothetical protein